MGIFFGSSSTTPFYVSMPTSNKYTAGLISADGYVDGFETDHLQGARSAG